MMRTMLSATLGVILCFGVTKPAKSEIWTSSLGACEQTGGTGTVKDSDRLAYNRMTVLEDAEKAVIFRCLIDLRSDKAITKIQLDFATDSASSVKDLAPDHADMQYYLPSCRLEVKYSPGGDDFIDLLPAKSVSWGNYNQLIIENPQMQNNGNGYTQYAILQCQTAYYSNETRMYGMRITYAD